MSPGWRLRALMSTWATSAAISGGADAVISSMVSVEAATLGLAYTHVSDHRPPYVAC
jgi:hypothetical protein